ncbi:hypothetical protein [Microbacterium sp. NIBRBAC000506063]|uniref:hypothetical protein n=1 Tax=Microbacterium sp. NIBRBAC000506063 TaxID=2734618 RepID=UPI001BB7E309|nr:hypothetical protein [Microbacterium sp. NIBRBAC000506063]QTV78995.1 hypothetical protein KAE78_07355 [Microbacterium sp. NIBRBAC000506063]
MSTHIPDPDDIGAVRPFASDDDALWGDIPRTDRLSWLRIASHHWPFFPGAAVGGLTARSLAQGRIVHSESLIRVARNAFDAGFTPDEYATLRRLIQGRTPAHLVTGRDHRPQHADDYYEIDAAQWRGWLDLVRAGESGERALAIFLTREQRPGVPSTTPRRGGQGPIRGPRHPRIASRTGMHLSAAASTCSRIRMPRGPTVPGGGFCSSSLRCAPRCARERASTSRGRTAWPGRRR